MRKTSKQLQQTYRQETKEQLEQEEDISEQCLEVALEAHLKDTEVVGKEHGIVWTVTCGLQCVWLLQWSPKSRMLFLKGGLCFTKDTK